MTDRGNIINCPNCKRLFSTPQGLGMHLKHGCSLSDKKSFALGKQPDREQLCREFTELTGGHWHEWRIHYTPNGSKFYCRCHSDIYLEAMELPDNPTYENPADVLKAMMKRDDYDDFLRELQKNHWLEIEEFIEKYIIEPGALLKAAVEWLKAEAAKD